MTGPSYAGSKMSPPLAARVGPEIVPEQHACDYANPESRPLLAACLGPPRLGSTRLLHLSKLGDLTIGTLGIELLTSRDSIAARVGPEMVVSQVMV